MRGLWLARGAVDFRTDLGEPSSPEGEALIRVITAGVCGTDLALAAGLHDFEGVPGHEFVGVVERGPAHLAGQRVVGEISAPCGQCELCGRGLGKHCRARTALGIRGRQGVFAERATLPIDRLHLVPDSVPNAAAVFVEPLAAAIEGTRDAAVEPGARVLVVGTGRLGQLVCRTLVLAGASASALGRHDVQLERLPAGVAPLRPGDPIPADAFDASVECTGNPEGLAIAIAATRPRGTVVLKSTYPGTVNLDAERVVVDEMRLVGSRCGPFPEALSMLAAGEVEVASLVDARFPLARGAEAFECASRPGALKILIDVA